MGSFSGFGLTSGLCGSPPPLFRCCLVLFEVHQGRVRRRVTSGSGKCDLLWGKDRFTMGTPVKTAINTLVPKDLIPWSPGI